MIESKTYRYSGHSKSDSNVYRSQKEIREWRKKDPLLRLRNYLLDNQLASHREITSIEGEVVKEIQEAVEFAENSPSPSLDALKEDVYA